jgi:hypothetical protein
MVSRWMDNRDCQSAPLWMRIAARWPDLSATQHSFYSPSLTSIHFTKVDANKMSSVFAAIHPQNYCGSTSTGRISEAGIILNEYFESPARTCSSANSNTSRSQLGTQQDPTYCWMLHNRGMVVKKGEWAGFDVGCQALFSALQPLNWWMPKAAIYASQSRFGESMVGIKLYYFDAIILCS